MTTKKYGTKGSKGPQWARTRAVILWNSGKNYKAPSWDYTKKFIGGVPIKVKSESLGITKLVEYICSIDPFQYRVINVFVNLTSNLNVITGDYNYHILTMVRGRLTWKDPMYWKVDEPNMLDIKKMKAYQDLKNDQNERERARMAVQLSLENVLTKNQTRIL